MSQVHLENINWPPDCSGAKPVLRIACPWYLESSLLEERLNGAIVFFLEQIDNFFAMKGNYPLSFRTDYLCDVKLLPPESTSKIGVIETTANIAIVNLADNRVVIATVAGSDRVYTIEGYNNTNIRVIKDREELKSKNKVFYCQGEIDCLHNVALLARISDFLNTGEMDLDEYPGIPAVH